MGDGTHTKKCAAKRLIILLVTSQLIISAPSIQEVVARLELSHCRIKFAGLVASNTRLRIENNDRRYEPCNEEENKKLDN